MQHRDEIEELDALKAKTRAVDVALGSMLDLIGEHLALDEDDKRDSDKVLKELRERIKYAQSLFDNPIEPAPVSTKELWDTYGGPLQM